MCQLFHPDVSPPSPRSRHQCEHTLAWLFGQGGGTSWFHSFSSFSVIGHSSSTVCQVFPFTFTFPDILSRTGILLTAIWDPRAGCVITSTDNTTLSATFIYSMCFDFIVLCLTGYKLSVTGNRSRLVHLMFADGLVYFFVAYV